MSLSSWKGSAAHKSGLRLLCEAGPIPRHRIVCCRVSCPWVYWQGTWKASALADGSGPSLVCTLRHASLFLHHSSWSTVKTVLGTHRIIDVHLYGHTVLWEIVSLWTPGAACTLEQHGCNPSRNFEKKLNSTSEYFFLWR